MQGYNHFWLEVLSKEIVYQVFIDAFCGKEAGVSNSGLGALDKCKWFEDTLVSSDLTACNTKSCLTLYNSYSDHTHVIGEPVSGIPVLFFILARVRRKQ
jgi:hypothetical protein